VISSLNDLRLVELERLILHEAHDESRLAGLRERIESEGVQRNPVIIAPLEDNYLVLDGAHRVHTMREMDSRFILAQLVEPPDKTESWSHHLTGIESSALRRIEEIEVSRSPDAPWLAELEHGNGARFYVRARGAGLLAEVRALWKLGEVYPNEGVVRRVESDQPVHIGDGETLIRYRPFTARELAEIVRSGVVLPAGITRFRIRERVLGVRFPLEKMKDGDLEARNADLRKFVEGHQEQNRIRYYGEPVVLFE
jgi:hypothetical protein